MKVLNVRNVNEALGIGIPYLLESGLEENSRNGTVIVAPTPVCTVYQRPLERVVFGTQRDANPFFHLMEALWMIGGYNDLEWPMQFNKRFSEYSDDGETLHGAYGHRWRSFFHFDQLTEIISHLRNYPNSRRAVLSMWSPEGDLITKKSKGGLASKDIPCNTHAYFDTRYGVLQMTVCNRSNDIIWGAYGANVVHFSMLQEYIANCLEIEVGFYRQISNNFHAYTDIYDVDALRRIAHETLYLDYYKTDPTMKHVKLISTTPARWEDDLHRFLNRDPGIYDDDFFNLIAEPMWQAWMARKSGDENFAMDTIRKMPPSDWRTACIQWIHRRMEKNHAA